MKRDDVMQLKQLEYLNAVSDTKSIRKASNQLFVSQQAISQSIQKFEEEYNVQLLNRSVHGITLTETGEYAVAIAKKIIALTTELELYFSKQNVSTTSGTLNISAINSITNYVLPEAQIHFLQQNPSVELKIQSMGTDDVIQSVFNKECDIGFFGNPYINDKSLFQIELPLHFVALSRYNYRVVVSKKSPLNNYNTLSVKSILNYPIIFLQEQLQENLADYIPYRVLSQFGKVDSVIANSIRFMDKLVQADMGISISTDGVFEEKLGEDHGIIKPLRDNIYGYFGYLIHEDNMENSLVSTFIDTIQAYVPME